MSLCVPDFGIATEPGLDLKLLTWPVFGLFGWLTSFTILSNSRFVATQRLSSNVGRDVLGIPMISKHLCIDCDSSGRNFGRPPHTGDAITEVSVSSLQDIVMPTSVGRFAFLHSLK